MGSSTPWRASKQKFNLEAFKADEVFETLPLVVLRHGGVMGKRVAFSHLSELLFAAINIIGLFTEQWVSVGECILDDHVTLYYGEGLIYTL